MTLYKAWPKGLNYVTSKYFLLILFISIINASNSKAFNFHIGMAEKIYSYHPDSTFAVGKGVNPDSPLKEHLRCIQHTDTLALDNQGAVTTKFYMQMVKTKKELLKTLSLSATLSAHHKFSKLGAKLEAGTNFEKTLEVKRDQIVIVLKAEADYGRHEYSDYVLKEQFQNMLLENSHEDFIKRCGTHFVVRERRKAMVAAIFKISNLSKKAKRKLNIQVGGGIEYGLGGVDAKTTFDLAMDMAREEGKVNVKFFALGGKGIGALNTMAASQDFISVSTAMGNYMESVDPSTAPAVKYYLAPMELFGLNAPVPNEDKDAVLNDLYFEYNSIEETTNKLKEELDTNLSLPSEAKKYYTEMYEIYEKNRQALWEASHKCVKENICEKPELDLPEVNFKVITAKLERGTVIFACNYKTSGRCGVTRDWFAMIKVDLQFQNPELLKSVQVYYKTSKTSEKIFRTSFFLNEQDLSYMEQHDGNLIKSLYSFSRNKNIKTYEKFRTEHPEFLLKFEDKLGNITWKNLGKAKLIGNHRHY